jgi:hypothetical protein
MASKEHVHSKDADRVNQVSAQFEAQPAEGRAQQIAPAMSGQVARPLPRDFSPQEVVYLQRIIGNRAVGRHLTTTSTPALIIQRASVTTKRGKVDQRITDEVLAIVSAAEAKNGADSSGDMLKSLQGVRANEKVASLDPGSRETYGISGASFFPGTQTYNGPKNLALPHLPCIWFRLELRGAGGATQGLRAHTPDVSIVSSG